MSRAGGGPTPLLVVAEQVARGRAAELPRDYLSVVAAFDATRVAVLFVSRSQRNRAQLGVFHVAQPTSTSTGADGPANGPATAPSSVSGDSQLVDLISAEDLQQAHEGEELSPQPEEWVLVWSPDGKFVVVTGAVWDDAGHKQAAVWVYSSSELMDISVSPPASSSAHRQPLLARVHLRDHVSAKEWKPTESIVTAFFHKSSSSRLFVLSSGGVLLKADVQVAKLTLWTINNIVPTEDDMKGLFKMSSVKNMTEWHAGVMSACFEPTSSNFVVCGGVGNPSDDLVSGNASSLSVWKLESSDAPIELLDYTMILKPANSRVDGEAASDGIADDGASTNEVASAVKSSIFKPLKFMIGAGNTKQSSALAGSIRQLSLSTDGNFVAMLSNDNRLAIRQIDTCADIVPWQTLDEIKTASDLIQPDAPVERIVWLSSSVIAFVSGDGTAIYAAVDTSNAGSTTPDTLRIVASYSYAPGISSSPNQAWRVGALGQLVATGPARSVEVCSLIVQDSVWITSMVRSVDIAPFVDLLVKAGQADEGLRIVDAHGLHDTVDADSIHRQIWAEFCKRATVATIQQTDLTTQRNQPAATFLDTTSNGNPSFKSAIHHLKLVNDKWWSLDECVSSFAMDSVDDMRELLTTGLNALMSIPSETLSETSSMKLESRREQVLRSLYRLETMELLVSEMAIVDGDDDDDQSPTIVSTSDYGEFDGRVFEWFVTHSLVDTATQLAVEGRVGALAVLFRRHAWNLIPHRLHILAKIPPSVQPTSYAHLLPAVAVRTDQEWQFFSLPKLGPGVDLGSAGLEGDGVDVVEVDLPSENRSNDLTADEVAAFESMARQDNSEKGGEYAAWFKSRILEIDGSLGQLGAAYQLSRLASSCLAEWSHGESKAQFDEFLMEVERLYNCVYPPLELARCTKLTLDEWTKIPFYEQAMMVIGEIESVTAAMERLQLVIMSQRHDRLYSLDDLLSWIVQTVLVEHPSLLSLELCSQLINCSNPSLPLHDRWIQSDSHLLRTAIDVVFATEISTILEEAKHRRSLHSTMTELLWGIFQSLPVRKEDDQPDIAHLQVEVDEMEDLMVAMDILAKYGILTTPGELKKDILSSEKNGPREVLEQMCEHYLTPPQTVPTFDEYSSTANVDELGGSQWMEVWQDAGKLKQHVFGERLLQEDILDTILRYLLAHEPFLNSAQDLIVNWILSNVEATGHVLDTLTAQVRANLDLPIEFAGHDIETASNPVVSKCVGMIRTVLMLPVVEQWDPFRKEFFEVYLQQEMELVRASQLVELLTNGSTKLSPSSIRSIATDAERLDVVVQVVTSDPANYRISDATKLWFERQGLASSSDDHPLYAILHLAKLFHVEMYKQEIVMKGAYAALYCSDYDVAHALIMDIVDETSRANGDESGAIIENSVPLLHLVSLVLDLVSATSFRSWSKKIAVCRAIFSMQGAGDLFAHQVTDLLLSWLQKLEAMEDLANELGLSESDLEKRQAAGDGENTMEEALMKELEIVMDLLKHETSDPTFLLRLLQKGFHLLNITISTQDTFNGGIEHSPASSSASIAQFLDLALRMGRLCVEEGVRLALEDDVVSLSSEGSVAKASLELGLSCLLLWNDLCSDDAAAKGLWENDILRWLFDQLSSPSPSSSDVSSTPQRERVIRFFHHYFMLVAASLTLEDNGSGSAEAWSGRRTKLETFSTSYDTLRGHFGSTNALRVDGEDMDIDDESNVAPRMVSESQRYKLFVDLATKCQAQLVSQQKNQEMEEVSSYFGENLDMDAFKSDEVYRSTKILSLATHKDQFEAAVQLAAKYDVDEYECVLAYIKHVLLPSGSVSLSTSVDRRKQLETAFQSNSIDFLELALQRPVVFGSFLLGDEGVYDSLDGTDHVGVLLVLRMVLECSKRAATQAGVAAPQDPALSLFPLSKPSSDRATLVFMCMKRLKDQVDGIDSALQETVDLKRICGASTTRKLLSPPLSDADSLASERHAAVQAALPLLSGKSVKIVTKILQKLYQVTPSPIVMLYLNSTLKSLWQQHGNASSASEELSSDLATYAYESCHPFLSVLSNEHLILFVILFLGKDWRRLPSLHQLRLDQEFYGLPVDDVDHFGDLLTSSKRFEVVSYAYSLLQGRFDTFRESQSPSLSPDDSTLNLKIQELEAVEYELVEACAWVVWNELKLQRQTNDLSTSDVVGVFESSFRSWCELDVQTRVQNRAAVEELVNTLFQAPFESERLLTLQIKLLFFLARISSDDGEKLIASRVSVAADAFARQSLDSHLDQWSEKVATEWATCFPTAKVSDEVSASLSRYLEAFTRSTGSSSDSAAFNSLVAQLSESSSPFLKSVANPQPTDQGSPVNESSARGAVIAQWSGLVNEYEAGREWTKAAVLSRVLGHASAQQFGLFVRAIWESVVVKFTTAECPLSFPSVFEGPTSSVADNFGDVFESLLTCIEDSAHTAFAQASTFALGNILFHREAMTARIVVDTALSSLWLQERQRAVQTRVASQFQIASPAPSETAVDADPFWSALFVRGSWRDDELVVQWYEQLGYAKLGSAAAVEQFVVAHWEVRRGAALHVLLMCPFDELRAKFYEQVMLAVGHVDRASPLWPSLLELCLLRLDTGELVRVPGLHASLVEFLLPPGRNRSLRWPGVWTSSSDYVICALVAAGQFAAAGRLACALWHVHPMLWDYENAQLVLGNLLQALVSRNTARASHEQQAIAATWRQFERERRL